MPKRLLFGMDGSPTHGGQWPASFSDRLNSQRPLQNSLAALLPSGSSHAHILDVGAGPLTYAGFPLSSRTIEVVAVNCCWLLPMMN